ncbi:MAG: cytidine deaminase [Bacteroidales bacterium]|nr:cytidine deaminase [Bacteroidales bacterium]MCF8454698.1 cytidine deaminase [Bacteroidales bacterium]
MIKTELAIEFFEIESMDELSENEQRLIKLSKEATKNSYAPYSNFYVGAAVLLESGETILGANQENAAYPSGLCAERVALFYANSKYPQQAVCAIAIAAANQKGILNELIAPCGSCRQVMLETEQRYEKEIKIFLVGDEKVFLINGVQSLLPMHFNKSHLSL